jgi:hypothetical protein
MRFGQLLCFASSTASPDGQGIPREAEDLSVLAAVKDHIPRRAHQLGVEINSTSSALPPPRGELVQVLENLGQHHPEWSLGQLVSNLAALAHVNIYDVEDEELLRTAQSHTPGLRWFQWYSSQLEDQSTIRERSYELSYDCPCCHYRTLYDRGGFEICPVCYWEDDGQDDEDSDTVRGGPNGSLSLTQARANYLEQGVCDPRFSEHVRPPRPQEMAH